MTLNPFFLHGSDSEQRLIQSLINEQLTMYGLEVSYLPQRFVRKETILEEVRTSKFTEQYKIEAYLSNYGGYSGSGDILSKFGMQLKDEVTLIISKERFEDFISPFLETIPDSENSTSLRPREGDLIWFPLGGRLFEIKFVEHEQPFYQLGKTYVYELKCELFEYTDSSLINTSLNEIDESLESYGYIKSLTLIGSGTTATASSVINQNLGYVSNIKLIDDGYNYTTVPTITIDSPPSGVRATAVAITSCTANYCSIKSIYLTNAGSGYISVPNVIISGSTGVGATAVAEVILEKSLGIGTITVDSGGSGYTSNPKVTFSNPDGGVALATASISGLGTVLSIVVTDGGWGYTSAPEVTISGSDSSLGTTATATAIISGLGTVSSIRIDNGGTDYISDPTVTISSNIQYKSGLSTATGFANVNSAGVVTSVYMTSPGYGYTVAPTLTVATPSVVTGIGTYILNEVVTGGTSGATARVKDWNVETKILQVGTINGSYVDGETITGSTSSASYTIFDVGENAEYEDKYEQNDEIQTESNSIIDFTEKNLFGNY